MVAVDDRLYVVIIGDVSGSKQLNWKSRYQTQLFMKSAIVQINEQFEEHIEAPFTITKGDEFQGLPADEPIEWLSTSTTPSAMAWSTAATISEKKQDGAQTL